MKKRQYKLAGASAAQLVLSAALISILALILASSFKAARAGTSGPISEQPQFSAPPSADPPQNCMWAVAAVMPVPILDQAVASLGNNLYSFSGVSAGAIVANSYKFDGTTWTPILNYPVATEWPTAVSDGTQFLYIMNGVSTGPVYQTTLYRYDPVANTYTQMASNTVGTWNQAAVYLNGKIYKMGGYNSAGAGQTALEIYTVSSNTWALGAPIPVGVGFPSAWASGNFIYYAGGITTAGQATAFRYDVAANTWTAITNLPATRWASAAAFYGDGGVVAGGYVGGDAATNVSNDARYSDGSSWTALPTSVQMRARMSGAVLGNSFYYIGGRSNGDTTFNGTSDNQKLTCSFQATPVITGAGATIQTEGCSPGNMVVDPGETVTVSFCVQNTGNLATTNLVGTLQASGGVTNPSGPQTYGALSPGAPAVCRSFTFTADTALSCGGSLTATIQFQDGATNLGNVTYNFVLGTSSVALSENFDGVTPPALPSGWTADQGTNAGGFPLWVTSNSGTPTPVADSLPNSAFSPDPSNLLDNRLKSLPLMYSAGSRLTFRQNYDLEQQNATTAYDAGVLEISNDSGATWQDIITAGGTFVTGGYNHTAVSTGFMNPIAGARASWSGISNGGAGGFQTCTVNLPASLAGQTVQFRWRMCSDNSVSHAGWRVDNVSISAPVCCVAGGPSPTPTPTPRPTPSPSPTPTATPTPTPRPTPRPTPTPTPGCPATITQSASQAITPTNSVSCNDGSGHHTDNSFWRAFNMASFTAGLQYNVASVSFGIETATAGGGGTQPATVKLYANNGGSFPGGTRTLIGTAELNVTNQTGTVLNVPLIASVPAGTLQLVMELFTPDGRTAGNSFRIGSNSAGQTGPSYISAAFCGVKTPTDLAVLGFPSMHIVMNINGSCPIPTPTPTPTPTATPTPTPPVPTSAVSRKTHDGAGTFDIDLPLTGTPGIECRIGGLTNDYTVVVTFTGNVTVTGSPQAQVTSGTATIGNGGVSNGGMVAVSGNVVTIPLTNVANAQTINVTLFGVNGVVNLVIPMSVLAGDVNGNRMVTAGDIVPTKARIGQPINQTNFRSDVNAGGTINATDVSIVKSYVGTGLP